MAMSEGLDSRGFKFMQIGDYCRTPQGHLAKVMSVDKDGDRLHLQYDDVTLGVVSLMRKLVRKVS